jgi:integrase
MASGLITKRAVDAVQPEARQTLLWDTRLKGFGLLVLPSGSRSYIFQYRIGGRSGRLRRYTIGRHGSPWTPDSARKRAEDLAETVRKGIDPKDAEQAELGAREREKERAQEEGRRNREMAFSDYVERFLGNGLKAGARSRTREGYASVLRNHITPVFGATPLPQIGRRDVVRVMDKIPADQPAVRRITFAVMRMLFKWAKGRGDIDISPLEGMDAPAPVSSRDRVLTDEELALALRAARDLGPPFGPFYRVLFATGQRREEVAAIEWSELGRGRATWTLPGTRSKNGEANIVPLNRHAIAALDEMAGQEDTDAPKWPRRGWVFSTNGRTAISGYSRAKARLDAKMLALARKDAEAADDDPDVVEIVPWRLHDARRTLATALQRLGVRFEVTEAVLNHTAGTSRTGVAAVYQRHGWGPEKKAALDAWADFCDRVLHPAQDADKVVRLHTANASLGEMPQ